MLKKKKERCILIIFFLHLIISIIRKWLQKSNNISNNANQLLRAARDDDEDDKQHCYNRWSWLCYVSHIKTHNIPLLQLNYMLISPGADMKCLPQRFSLVSKEKKTKERVSRTHRERKSFWCCFLSCNCKRQNLCHKAKRASLQKGLVLLLQLTYTKLLPQRCWYMA